MEIQKYCCYIFINCVLIPSLLSKPISLNDIIAAEEKSESLQSTQTKTSETKVRRIPKDQKISPIFAKHMTTETITAPSKIVSPLKYKKTFQIRTPLRPKKIKYLRKPRIRLINTTTKRETNKDDNIYRNYIPLLKSLSVLFNNILSSDSGEDETGQSYNKHPPISNSEECQCAFKSQHKFREQDQAEKATALSPPVTAKVSSKAKIVAIPETTSTSTDNTLNDNNSPLRRNKNLSILSARNTTSSRRNNNGFGESSLPAHYRNFERHIAGNNGSNESYNSGRQETESPTENNKGNSDSTSRDDGSCYGACGSIGRNRNITEDTEYEKSSIETDSIWSSKTFSKDRGDSDQFERDDQFENRRNKTESRKFLSQSNTRLRGNTSQKEVTEILWKIQGSEESTLDVTYNITSNQRISDRDGSMATEDQGFRRTNKTITLEDSYINKSFFNPTLNIGRDKQKIVMIYDGYSIARDANGDNKFKEKLYRIHS